MAPAGPKLDFIGASEVGWSMEAVYFEKLQLRREDIYVESKGKMLVHNKSL